ncbi:MAG: phosphate-starvation-inducible PsiE family protein [Actinobacteria bacterium]|nr:phosphate-starvation-inducible PsiE family protein [Actinomycetota bacterium]
MATTEAPEGSRRRRAEETAGRTEERTKQKRTRLSGVTDQGLHVIEDIVYAITALFLAAGAGIVLVVAAYNFAKDVNKDVKEAIEVAIDWLLIVFILVELLSAVRTAIKEHKLVAEPFLLVGVLAAIKEMVVVATFRIETQKTSDAVLKIGVLSAVVLGLAVASYVLRRSQREPEETEEE